MGEYLLGLDEDSEPIDNRGQAQPNQGNVNVGVPFNCQLLLLIKLFHLDDQRVNSLKQEIDDPKRRKREKDQFDNGERIHTTSIISYSELTLSNFAARISNF